VIRSWWGMGWLLLLSLAAPGLATGQWVLDLSAGAAQHDLVSASLDTRDAVLGVRYEGLPWLYLSGAVPLDSASLPWGAGGVGGRAALRRAGLDLGVDLGAHAFAYHDPTLDASGGGATGQVVPFVGFTRAGARVEIGSGILHYRSLLEGETVLDQTVHQTAATVAYSPRLGLTLTGEGRYARAEQGDYPYLGATAEYDLRRGEVWAALGRWLSDDMTSPVWSVGGSWNVNGRVQVRASVDQESEDPLYWNAPRRSWSVGVSHSLGRAALAAPPVPVVPVAAGGRVTIRLPVSESAEAPSGGGDFNEWTPVAMTRSGDDWVVSLPLKPGVYHYGFRGKDGEWFVPASVPNRVDDGFGGYSAVLVVSAGGGG